MTSTSNPEALMAMTAQGTSYAMLPLHTDTPAPTLLLFAAAAAYTQNTEPYSRVGHLLHSKGWNVVSLDAPCHGDDVRPGEPPELAGWAARIGAGEDIIAEFQARVNDLVEHLVTTGVTDPARIAAAGSSRGGFMAFQAAAACPRIRAVVAFAPVTDLIALREFAGQEQNPLVKRLALANAVESLADRDSWITIGYSDERVDTDKAVAFARALAAASQTRFMTGDVALHVLPVPGHSSFPEWHDDAAIWLQDVVSSTIRILPSASHPLAVPCSVYPPERETGGKAGLVIHLYGSGGSHTYYNIMRPSYARLRKALREKGYWLIVPDLGPTHWMNLGAVSVLDAIISELTESGKVDPARVHLLGTSMGGGSALIYASQRPQRVRSVISIFPMTDLAAWTAERPNWLNPITQAHVIDSANAAGALRDLSPLHHPAAFVDIPMFILHGEADEVVPVHHSRDFAAAVNAAGGNVTYHEIPGGGHDDVISLSWQDEMLDFIISTDTH